jgi:hypothetical protein
LHEASYGTSGGPFDEDTLVSRSHDERDAAGQAQPTSRRKHNHNSDSRARCGREPPPEQETQTYRFLLYFRHAMCSDKQQDHTQHETANAKTFRHFWRHVNNIPLMIQGY